MERALHETRRQAYRLQGSRTVRVAEEEGEEVIRGATGVCEHARLEECNECRIFQCECCARFRPWSEGAADDQPDMCDACWAAVHELVEGSQ